MPEKRGKCRGLHRSRDSTTECSLVNSAATLRSDGLLRPWDILFYPRSVERGTKGHVEGSIRYLHATESPGTNNQGFHEQAPFREMDKRKAPGNGERSIPVSSPGVRVLVNLPGDLLMLVR